MKHLLQLVFNVTDTYNTVYEHRVVPTLWVNYLLRFLRALLSTYVYLVYLLYSALDIISMASDYSAAAYSATRME